MPTLEECIRLAVDQAEKKGWNNTNDWLYKKVNEEFTEFLNAFEVGDPEEIVKELSDLIIVAGQMKENKAKKENLDFTYVRKIADNYANKKKTWDDKKQMVVRK